MALANPVLVLPYQAKAATAITKFRAVKLDADERVIQAAGVTDVVIGIAQVDVSATEATDGKGVAVMVHGVSYVESGAVITRGARVRPLADGTGRVEASTTTGDTQVGIALKAAGSAGEWIPVLLTPGVKI